MSEHKVKVITKNRKAFHDYHVLERLEAGIVLTGTEVKSIRESNINLKDSYAALKRNEIYLVNVHISPYRHGNIHNHDPVRDRKLLLHRTEIDKLIGKIKERGMTLVPLTVYLKQGRVKVELGLAKGKKEYDKRADIAKKDMDREMRRETKHKVRFRS